MVYKKHISYHDDEKHEEYKAGKSTDAKSRALNMIDSIDVLLKSKKDEIRPMLADQVMGRLGIIENIIKDDLKNA